MISFRIGEIEMLEFFVSMVSKKLKCPVRRDIPKYHIDGTNRKFSSHKPIPTHDFDVVNVMLVEKATIRLVKHEVEKGGIYMDNNAVFYMADEIDILTIIPNQTTTEYRMPKSLEPTAYSMKDMYNIIK